jgi:hypothetical protein
MSSILSKLRNLFGFTPPEMPKIPGTGNRGIAARSIKNPNLRAYEQRIAAGLPNTIGNEELNDFINGGNMIFVHSSNVAGMQYFPEEQKLMIEFLNGSAYLYSSITRDEALQFAQNASKGKTVWDLLRVRGSKTAHKKPYKRIK